MSKFQIALNSSHCMCCKFSDRSIGQPPKVTSNQFTANGASFSDPDTSLHIEAFYRWPIAENIATTAGILVITNPDHNATNNTTYVGVIRTLVEF